MKSIERRFRKLQETQPLRSDYLNFAEAVREGDFSPAKIHYWFNRLVNKGEYESGDKRELFRQLENLSTPLRRPQIDGKFLFVASQSTNSIARSHMTTENLKIEPLLVTVWDSISICDAVIIGINLERITTWDIKMKGEPLVSVAEYRQITGDQVSTNRKITERLQYLEAFCRNIINPELHPYVKRQKRNGE